MFEVPTCHYLLDRTNSALLVSAIVRKYPNIIKTYIMSDQINVEVLRILLSNGYLPSESYIYRICERELVNVVRLLCEYDVFRKVIQLDDMSVYASKRLVATVLLEYGLISEDVFFSFSYVWEQLGM